MAVLTIRHVDEAIKTALRVRAAREGVSMEEEARRILCDALSQQQEQMPLGQRLLLDSGTLTPLLKRLQSLGLLTRQRDREDERAVCLQLTAAGLAMREQAMRLRQQLLCQQGLDTPAMQAWRLALGEQLQPLLALADEAPGSV